MEACPPIAAGDGSVVTACIKTRVASELVRVVMSDGTELTGTKVHPVWSLDRNDWVSLGDLVEGENLATELGPISVSSLELYRTTEPVYNFETHGEHVYQVTQLGLLVHNAYTTLKGMRNPKVANAIKNGKKSHDAFRALAKATGWKTDVFVRFKNGKYGFVEALTKSRRPLELKPCTLSGIAKGKAQLPKYEASLGKKGGVIYY